MLFLFHSIKLNNDTKIQLKKPEVSNLVYNKAHFLFKIKENLVFRLPISCLNNFLVALVYLIE